MIEAARRNNTELLQEVIDSVANPEKMAILLNNTKTVLGNHIYHEAALKGNCTSQSYYIHLVFVTLYLLCYAAVARTCAMTTLNPLTTTSQALEGEKSSNHTLLQMR